MSKSTANTAATCGIGLLIFVVALAAFMSALDGTIVNIAIPTISEIFNLSASSVSWVATIYLLVMAGCILICGKVADVVGFKKIFLAGFAIFTIGSFACGFFPGLLDSYPSLLIGRVLQAVGGAMLMAIAPAMITTFVPLSQKGKAMGILMTIAALGTALGPVLGGFLTQYLSWEWIFYINVPVGIVAIALGFKAIPVQDKSTATLKTFDKYGAVLIFLGLATLLYAFSEGLSLGWTSPVILGCFAVAAVTLAGFVIRQLRYAEPLLDLRLFKNPNFFLTNLAFVLVIASFAGINYLMPFFLQYVRDFSVSDAGLVLTSLSIGMMVTGILSGILFNKFGGKILCIVGALLLLAGYFQLWHMDSLTSTEYIIGALFVVGLGLGMMMSPLTNMILSSVAKGKQGMVSSLTGLEQFAPMTIGIAVYNLILVWGITTIAAAENITEAAPVSIQMDLLAHGFDVAFLASFILAVFVLILSLVIRQKTHPDHQGSTELEHAGGII
ncbi:DHA2 family efflux MFS transporter permease subunit [Methanorbis rubei]|uniref:Multidrug resistance protein MdtD n=1 Tax=Methanorbis rubei TaxID=3028300 RepID=A0AAE4MJ21_9EURY|nr:putative multidrug resistance protein MdtD [Methanocorpusculaceae archaeon Cs1]